MKKSAIGGSLIVLATLSGCGMTQVNEPGKPLAAEPQARQSGALQAGRLEVPPQITLEEFKQQVRELLPKVKALGPYVTVVGSKVGVQTNPGRCPPIPPEPIKTAGNGMLYRAVLALMVADESADESETYAVEDDRCWIIPK